MKIKCIAIMVILFCSQLLVGAELPDIHLGPSISVNFIHWKNYNLEDASKAIWFINNKECGVGSVGYSNTIKYLSTVPDGTVLICPDLSGERPNGPIVLSPFSVEDGNNNSAFSALRKKKEIRMVWLNKPEYKRLLWYMLGNGTVITDKENDY